MSPLEMVNVVASRLLGAPPPGMTTADVEGFLARRRPEMLHALGALAPNHDRIVTLNLGLGRDSLTMLCLLVDGRLRAEGRVLAPDEVDAVVFSDPGAEWQSTYALIPRVRELCERHKLRFVVLSKPPAEEAQRYLDQLPPRGDDTRREAVERRPWRSRAPASIEEKAASGWYHLRADIVSDYGSRATIAARAKKDCTINHKVDPIRKLIQDLSLERFGLDNVRWGAAVRAGERRPHLTLVGFAADELERALVTHPLQGGSGPWYVTEAYPLIELGLSKRDEARVLSDCGFNDAHKSGCTICPFQPASWYWALRESDPVQWGRAVEYEARALAANPRMFILGDRPIAEIVEAWRARHPEATVPAVMAKAYSRCVRSGLQAELFAEAGPPLAQQAHPSMARARRSVNRIRQLSSAGSGRCA